MAFVGLISGELDRKRLMYFFDLQTENDGQTVVELSFTYSTSTAVPLAMTIKIVSPTPKAS